MSSDELVYMNWRKMISPEKVVVTTSSTYGKFVCEPLERGFGITIGNSLRRIILSSLYGAAIVSVKFDDALHEYSVISDIREDVSEIIMNLKEVKLKVDDPEERVMTLLVQGEKNVTAADLVSQDGRVEILNPEQPIATLSKNGELNMTMLVKTGTGYSLAAANKDDESPLGTIPIDSVFSPIKRVKYVVGTSRVGQKADYDKLTMEVWTDGSVTPEDSIAFAAKILKEQMDPFINFDEEIEPEQEEREGESIDNAFNDNLYRSVDELELSVRSANCLKNAQILKLYQLVQKTDNEMLKTKNFGRKSLNEIKEVLSSMDLTLGMDLDGFEPPDEEYNNEGE
ncbi:MAG: DNA-directed RNA polymerase subunit alpha [Thermodesulfobacteriota bacterium]|nr:DNA-directed RNA polymerase subunit alpha [Thermodesulfobacteriota bacterium]